MSATCCPFSFSPLLDFRNALGIAVDYMHPARRCCELLTAIWLPGNHGARWREKDILTYALSRKIMSNRHKTDNHKQKLTTWLPFLWLPFLWLPFLCLHCVNRFPVLFVGCLPVLFVRLSVRGGKPASATVAAAAAAAEGMADLPSRWFNVKIIPIRLP